MTGQIRFLCVAIGFCLFAACSKKEEAAGTETATENAAEAASATPSAAPAAPGAETLPGENAVRSALASKNYDSAVSQLIAMKQGLPNEMWPTYMAFYGEVRDTLIEASSTDPKAAQSLAILRGMTAGR